MWETTWTGRWALRCGVLGVLSAALSAQQVVEVYRAPEGATVRTVDMRCRGLAATADGTLFVVMIEDRPGEGLARRSLRLLASRTKGLTWETCDTWPVGPFAEASLAADPVCPRVHVVYTTRDGEVPALSLAHRVFDAEASAWTGPQEIVRAAKSADDQFQVADVETDAEGALLVTAQGFLPHDKMLGRYPGFLLVRRPDGEWRQRPVDGCNEGGAPQLVRAGARTVLAYRGSRPPENSRLRFRSLDATSLEPGDIEQQLTRLGDPVLVPGLDRRPDLIERAHSMPPVAARRFACVADIRGGLQVLYMLASPFGSEYRLTSTPDQDEPIHRVVDRDAVLKVAGEDVQHFGLVRGPGAELFAVYSKIADAHATLWWRQFGDGPPSEPRLLASDAEGAFAQINTYRSGHFDCTLFALAAGPSTLAPGGRIVAVGVMPARVTRTVAPPK